MNKLSSFNRLINQLNKPVKVSFEELPISYKFSINISSKKNEYPIHLCIHFLVRLKNKCFRANCLHLTFFAV
jgi:hypothetical protein